MKRTWIWLAVAAAVCAADLETNAWDVLHRGLAESNPLKRAEAVVALNALGPLDEAVDLAEEALADKDAAVRQRAAAVLGEMQALRSAPKLRAALDDESPEVGFTAAKALWQMSDRAGREVFWDVLAGERKTSEGPIKGGIRDARNKLHNPRGLVLIGINEGAGALLGPFSMGVDFAEDWLKDKSAPARALAAKLLADDPDPASLGQLLDAFGDKNAGVRAAAARAVGQRADKATIAKLEPLLADSNDGVRYTAAAAVIRLSRPQAQAAKKSGPAPKPPARRSKK